MEFNIVTLDMIFTLGIKEFSGVALSDGMIEQLKIIRDDLHFWDTSSEVWESFCLIDSMKGHLEKHYHTFFTWELVHNEI